MQCSNCRYDCYCFNYYVVQPWVYEKNPQLLGKKTIFNWRAPILSLFSYNPSIHMCFWCHIFFPSVWAYILHSFVITASLTAFPLTFFSELFWLFLKTFFCFYFWFLFECTKYVTWLLLLINTAKNNNKYSVSTFDMRGFFVHHTGTLTVWSHLLGWPFFME